MKRWIAILLTAALLGACSGTTQSEPVEAPTQVEKLPESEAEPEYRAWNEPDIYIWDTKLDLRIDGNTTREELLSIYSAEWEESEGRFQELRLIPGYDEKDISYDNEQVPVVLDYFGVNPQGSADDPAGGRIHVEYYDSGKVRSISWCGMRFQLCDFAYKTPVDVVLEAWGEPYAILDKDFVSTYNVLYYQLGKDTVVIEVWPDGITATVEYGQAYIDTVMQVQE